MPSATRSKTVTKIRRYTAILSAIALVMAIAETVVCNAEPEGASKQQLVTLYSDELTFGTSIYPFRRKVDPALVISEAKALGLTAVRVEYSRDRVEKSESDDSDYNPANYLEPREDILSMLKGSGMDITFTLDGKRRDKQGRVQDYPKKGRRYGRW